MTGSASPSEVTSSSRSRARSRAWTAFALVFFGAAVCAQYAEIMREGFGGVVPVDEDYTPETNAWRDVVTADLIYEVWLVSRNAHAFREHPLDFFDGPHCHPFDQTVTLGIPMVAMGFLAVPVTFFSDEPVVTYNVVIMIMLFLACVAMFLLVREWTGIPAAAVVAGLFYGFSPIRLLPIHFPSQLDDIWTVFALFFATRLLARGRWRYAFGLALSFALQATESFYPFLAAVFLTPPILVWMVASYRLREVRFSQIAFLGASAAFVLWWMYAPYLGARDAGMLTARGAAQTFAPLIDYLPGGFYYPGTLVVVLAAIALLTGRRGFADNLPGDPRWFLVVSFAIVTWAAVGPNAALETGLPIPDLYAAVAHVVPGLDNIRGTNRLVTGSYLVSVVLAGFGAASLIRISGAWRPSFSAWMSGALILVAAIGVAKPGWLGLYTPYSWGFQEIEPDREAIAFYEELAEKGNSGPVLELPFDYYLGTIYITPHRIFLNHYHGRRTSACYGSFHPPDRHRITEVALDLPKQSSLEQLHAMGFTTVVAHHGDNTNHRFRTRVSFGRQRKNSRYRLNLIHKTAIRSAWEIEVVEPDAALVPGEEPGLP